MAISRQTLVLAGLVAILTVVCIALVIALDSYHGEYLETGEEANTELEPEAELKGGRRSNAALLVHPWEKNPRLSREVLPLHYELYLHPDLDSGTFMGESELGKCYCFNPFDSVHVHVGVNALFATHIIKGWHSLKDLVCFMCHFSST